MQSIRHIWRDLRCFTLFPKRYRAPKGLSDKDWSAVMRSYGNMRKRLRESGYRWHIITYKDGRMELTYIRVLQGGIFSGMYPAIYRGIIIPRMIDYVTYYHIESIKLAF